MATIATAKPKLVGFGESVDTALVTVDASGTAFEFEDFVVVASGVADKAEAFTATSIIALAAEPSTDAYYEPVQSGAGSFGSQSTEKQVILLGGVEIEMSVEGAISQSNIGATYDLKAAGGTLVADLAAASTSGLQIIRMADPVYGGVLGDTNARVIGRITDANCL